MTSVISINKRILKEIDSLSKSQEIKELARDILQFEMENWRIENVHFREYFDKLISYQVKKRLLSD